MKWTDDLSYDIKTYTDFDDQDWPDVYCSSPTEVTDCNRAALLERFLRVKDTAKAVLEIGVCRNKEDSFTHVFLKNKNSKTIYVGIDLDDKSFLNDKENCIYTIQGTSSDVENNMNLCRNFGVEQFDFIFIDGWHSINQVLIDWEYTRWLSPTGIVGFHDTSGHPGPRRFVSALDKNKWNVEENLCVFDYGIGFTWKK